VRLTFACVTKASEWSTRVAAWRASGKTSKQFCKERGYSPGSLLWWSSELNRRRTAPSRDNPLGLTRVVRRPEPDSAGLRTPLLVHGDGVRVEIPAGADTSTLALVIDIVVARARTGGS
jgi:hypothetical protein